jgi:hypothetical protein
MRIIILLSAKRRKMEVCVWKQKYEKSVNSIAGTSNIFRAFLTIKFKKKGKISTEWHKD